MIKVKVEGNFNKTLDFLKKGSNLIPMELLHSYGKKGVAALSSATPKNTGATSEKWSYVIKRTNAETSITWTNDSITNGIPIVILLQYGHTTRNGGYVSGLDFINPAMKDIMTNLANDMWKEVNK